MKLRVLDLFAGIGGFSLGLERTGGFETVAFCEIEEFPRKILAKHWPDVPIFEDVRKLKGVDIGPVDVICGGYPCQPFSTAGRRQGKGDERHLWPEFSRLVDELRPTWVIGENVAGHISMGLDDVLSDLEAEGYACRPFIIPACAVGAPHRRDRVWIVANARSGRRGEPVKGKIQQQGRAEAICSSETVADAGHSRVQQRGINDDGGSKGHIAGGISRDVLSGREEGKTMADTASIRQPRSGKFSQRGGKPANGEGQTDNVVAVREQCVGPVEPRMGRMDDGISRWLDEPDIGRVATGVKDRANRLKALGNAVVPQIPEMIGRAILEIEAGK